MIVTGEQLRGARAMVRIEQSDLAARSGLSVDTIKRLERTEGPISANVATMSAVVTALEAAGVEFIAENGGGPGVRLRKRAKARAETPKAEPAEDDTEPEPEIEANPPQYHGMETPAEPDAGISRVRSPLHRFNR